MLEIERAEIAASDVSRAAARARNPDERKRSPDHPLREALLRVLRTHPGLSSSELAREVKRGWGTIQHHLRSLEERGLVERYRTARENRYFPKGVPEATMREVALLRRGRVWEVARLVLARPGIGLSLLASTAGMSRKVLRDYLQILGAEGLVVRKRTLVGGQRVFPGRLLELLRSEDPIDAVVARLVPRDGP